jgi:hypothetical protein
MAAIDNILARLARAKEQASAIQGVIAAFARSESHKIVSDKNADRTEHYTRVYFDPQLDILRIGVLFGEYVHQLRSALDNLAVQLVISSGGAPSTLTEFPIFNKAKGFRKDSARKMRGMKPAITAEIERLQPYNARGNNPETTALWLIHRLNIVDKHQIILPVVMAHQESMLRFPKDCTLVEAKTVQHGAVLWTVHCPSPRDEVHVDGTFNFQIGIEDRGQRFRLKDLFSKMTEEAETITGRLRNFL